MSEIQIIVPMSAFAEGTELTPAGIAATLQDTVAARAEAEQTKVRYNTVVSDLRSAGNSLSLILTEVDDEYEKLKALRRFAEELKQYGQTVREMP